MMNVSKVNEGQIIMKDIFFWEFQHNRLEVSVASSNIGVVSVKLGFRRENNFISQLKRCVPNARFFRDFKTNELLIGAIDDYLNVENSQIDLPWDISGTSFMFNVWKNTCKIPFGETRSYKDVAYMCGNKKAARAVGQALNKNPLLIIIPCHRVVSVNGLGGFGSGIDMKKYLLNLEKGKSA